MTTENTDKLSTEQITYIAECLGVELEDGQLNEDKKRQTAELLVVLYEMLYPSKK